ARGLLAVDAADRGLIGLCAVIENDLAVLVRKAGRSAEAEPLFRSVIDRRTRLAAADPADRNNRRELVIGRYNLANLLRDTDRMPAAEAEYRAAISPAEKLAAEFAAVPDY